MCLYPDETWWETPTPEVSALDPPCFCWWKADVWCRRCCTTEGGGKGFSGGERVLHYQVIEPSGLLCDIQPALSGPIFFSIWSAESEWLYCFLGWVINNVTVINLEDYLFPRPFFQMTEGMKQVRLRLAACRMIPHGEMTSDLPGGEWKISPTRHVSASVSHLFLFYKLIVPIIVCIHGVIKKYFSSISKRKLDLSFWGKSRKWKWEKKMRETIISSPVNTSIPSFSRRLINTLYHASVCVGIFKKWNPKGYMQTFSNILQMIFSVISASSRFTVYQEGL